MKNGLIVWDRDEIPEGEIRGRIASIQKAMEREDLDALIVFGDVNEAGCVNYLSNFSPYYFSTALVLGRTGEGLMTTAMAQRGRPWIQSNSLTQDIRFERDYGKGCSQVLEQIPLVHTRVGIVELDLFPFPAYSALKARFPGVDFLDATGMVNEFRLVRSPVEKDLIRRAGQIADRAMAGALQDWTFRKECELAAEVERQARYLRCQDVFVHVSSHADGRRWLHLPTERELEKEVMVEIMVQYKNFWAQLGRTVIQRPEDASLLHLRDTAARTYSGLQSMLKPGNSVGEIFRQINGNIKPKGLGIFSSMGFGLYVEAMQRAWLNDPDGKYQDLVLRKNMAVSFQFGLLDPVTADRYMIQDTFILDDQGPTRCTRPPMELTY